MSFPLDNPILSRLLTASSSIHVLTCRVDLRPHLVRIPFPSRLRLMVQATEKAILPRWSMTTLTSPYSSPLRSLFTSLHVASYSSTKPIPLPLSISTRSIYICCFYAFLPKHTILVLPIRYSYKRVYTYTWYLSSCASALLDTPTSRRSGLIDPCCKDPFPAGIQRIFQYWFLPRH